MNITAFGLNNVVDAAIAVDAAQKLMDAAAKSTALLVAVALVAFILRRASAATVHRVWTLGFCGCLLIPIVTHFAALASLPILPDASQAVTNAPRVSAIPYDVLERQSSLMYTFGSDTTGRNDASRMSPVVPSAVQTSEVASTSTRSSTAVVSSTLVSSSSSSPAGGQLSWTKALLLAWLTGVVLCALRWLWQIRVLKQVLSRCRPLESSDWMSGIAEASHLLGFRRDVRLVQSDAARSPAVAGVLRTIVILPPDADDWPAERRQLVLLHELGHAQRRDLLTHAIARVVCAVYWFNPLCWLGLVQMGKLRELACDDLVLASGQQPANYADVLLDVARSYRHRSHGVAVGMARRANVEERILAILDRARNRMSLSPQAARHWALGTMAVVLLLSSLRLTTQAEPTVAAGLLNEPNADARLAAAEKPEPAANDDTYTMQVRITDEEGRPLEGASLHVSIWKVKDSKSEIPRNRDFIAKSDGIVDVELPRRLMILRMWPAKSGYVPEFVNFSEGTHDEGLLMPDEFDFRLAQGTKLSGIVVNEAGNPISGVSVEVQVEIREPAWTTNPTPMISTWLTDTDFNSETPVTDSEGRWSINNAPAPAEGEPYVFRLKHTHPNYVKDTRWGELQEQQGVTTDMLRNGTARIVLSRGATVKGTVVGPDSQPVTKGLVVWHDNPYLAQGVNETEIDANGRFETLPLSPGEYPITVIAPGFMPVRQMISVKTSMDESKFELKAGKKLVMKIVDPGGNPLPNAYVMLVSWGESKAIYNHKHSNVPESGIPRRADEKGVYVWDWAPDDAVTYAVSAEEFAQREVTLVANGTEHVVELSQSLVATGRVTDAQTGAPIVAFTAIPVTEFRPQFLSTSYNDSVPGQDGTYELTLDDHSRSGHRYRARIEAPGYRSVLSEQSFAPEDGRVNVDFELERAPARIGKVVDAEGRPVAGASIIEGTPSDVPMMRDGGVEWGKDRKTGPDGSFELPATFEPVRVRAVHPAGIAEVLRQPKDEIGTLQLQPWASLSGRLVHNGQPVAQQLIIFNALPDRGLGEARFQDSYQAQTDASGYFKISRVPPGRASVRAYLGPWEDSPLTSSESVPLDLMPGEQKEITLGGNGVTVTGKVNATGRGNVELNQNWSLNYLIRRDAPSNLPADFPPLSFDPSGPVQSSWFLATGFYSWLATRPNYFVKLSPDGRFQINGVPPGQYDLVLRLYEQPAGCLVETIGTKAIPIEVTAADSAAGTKDVGTIDVACRVGPRVGENMQAYKIVDRQGQLRAIQDLHGHMIVLHVWASWCAPCLQHMPEIQSAVADWKDRPVTVVGLNLDEDRGQAESLVNKHGWNWAQMYLGADSDMARQLAISAVPTYYLIGGDGTLIAASTEWAKVVEAVATSNGSK